MMLIEYLPGKTPKLIQGLVDFKLKIAPDCTEVGSPLSTTSCW
jgi:hypothetical protein